MTEARYDAWAAWYEDYLDEAARTYGGAADELLEMLGQGSGSCLDLGCGVGQHVEQITSLGWTPVGLDLSSNMLRLARKRAGQLVQAAAERLPFAAESLHAVASCLTYTDFDDVEPVFAEVARVLRPGGRFALVGTHPCFVGPFAEWRRADSTLVIHEGYRTTERLYAGPGLGDGVRSKVGVRHVPLSELLSKLLASGLRLDRVDEPGTDRTPWLIALRASKV